MSTEIRDLIRQMRMANPLWGAPRIHGELLKLGIEVSQATVGRYMLWRPSVLPDLAHLPAQPHVRHGRGRHVRCRNRHIPASLRLDRSWPRPQKGHPFRSHSKSNAKLARSPNDRAFPWDTAPRYLLRDRDASYGQVFRDRVRAMGIKEVVIAARSPWQNAYVERIIGSIRRECLNHVIIFDERHLRGILSSYFHYYHKTRTHLSLDKDCSETRSVHRPATGNIIAFPEIDGLHHRYERRAA
jgi:transposase InsO family protein